MYGGKMMWELLRETYVGKVLRLGVPDKGLMVMKVGSKQVFVHDA
jgi:hypothetical protein